MKLLILLIFVMVLFTGCSNKDNSMNDNQSNISYENYQLTKDAPSASRTSREQQQTPKEEEIASFSTPILIKEDNRQNNVSIACSELNGKIVNPGETFSFTNTLGPAKPEEGYKKADTFQSDGDIVKEYGGGKCQISSTLYNAVLKIPKLTIVERHEHSRDVDYVPERTRCSCSIWQRRFQVQK